MRKYIAIGYLQKWRTCNLTNYPCVKLRKNIESEPQKLIPMDGAQPRMFKGWTWVMVGRPPNGEIGDAAFIHDV